MPQIIRSLAKNPGFTIVAVLTLALGTSANTAVFNVVNAVLLRPLPYPSAERIVQIWRVSAEDRSDPMNAPDFLEFGRANSTLQTIAGYREDPTTIAAAGRDPIRVTGADVTVEFFDVFGIPAAVGRTFTAAALDHALPCSGAEVVGRPERSGPDDRGRARKTVPRAIPECGSRAPDGPGRR